MGQKYVVFLHKQLRDDMQFHIRRVRQKDKTAVRFIAGELVLLRRRQAYCRAYVYAEPKHADAQSSLSV